MGDELIGKNNICYNMESTEFTGIQFGLGVELLIKARTQSMSSSYMSYTLPTDELFNLEFQLESVFN